MVAYGCLQAIICRSEKCNESQLFAWKSVMPAFCDSTKMILHSANCTLSDIITAREQ